MENDLKFLRMLNHYHIPSQVITEKLYQNKYILDYSYKDR